MSVLDLACGKGQDIMKWSMVQPKFYVGLDIDREGLINPVDGAISRYNHQSPRE
jgi:ubiquinone/menaquinone biosynthesis C-methylase UbiE